MGMGLRGVSYIKGLAAGVIGGYAIDKFFIKKDNFKEKLQPVND